MNSCALVTGGSGFIGGHLVERLLDEGWRVRVLDMNEPLGLGGVEWVRGDVRERSTMIAASLGASVVIHLGCVVGVDDVLIDPVAAVDVAVNGTLNALDAAHENGAALVHFSSSEVLGSRPMNPAGESDPRVLGSPLVDRWAYASAKAAAEHVVIGGGHRLGVPTTIIRPFNVYGPRQSDRFVVGRMVRAALRREPIEIHGDGTQSRCFTYVDDLVDGVMRVVERVGVGPVIHLGSNEETTIAELALIVEELTGSDTARVAESRSNGSSSDYEDVARRVPDGSAARTLLGWEPRTDLRTGIARTVDWFRDSLSISGLKDSA